MHASPPTRAQAPESSAAAPFGDAHARRRGFILSLPPCLTLQLTITVQKNTKWRRNYSNLSTEIIGVDTCHPWKQFLSKLKCLEIFLNFKLCKSPFSLIWQRHGFNCRLPSGLRRAAAIQALSSLAALWLPSSPASLEPGLGPSLSSQGLGAHFPELLCSLFYANEGCLLCGSHRVPGC